MQTIILDALSDDNFDRLIKRASELLSAGELVAFPTETVYGLGADARNAEAIAKVFAAKGRPSDNPMIVHVANAEQIAECGTLDDRASKLAAAFMPGPLTLVIPASDLIPEIARAGLPTVAVRVPSHRIALALIAQAGPLVAPSANLSGKPSPTTAQHVYDDLAGRIAAVLDGGPCSIGIESTVVDVSSERAVILRPGHISRSQIEEVLGEVIMTSAADSDAPRSPGMKYRHYAPSVPVRLIVASQPPDLEPMNRMILTTAHHLGKFDGMDAHLLNEQSLYSLLREADAIGVDEVLIYAEPDELEAGLLNRVRKAAGK